MALADIPFYGTYVQRRQMNEQQPMQELQQASGAMGLLAQLQKQEQAGQLREALAATGGDVEKALEVAVKTGNIDAAHQLAPLVEARRKAQPQPRVMSPGSQLVGPNNEVLHEVPHRPPNPPAPPAPPEVVRLLQMKEQHPQFAAQIDARVKQLTERAPAQEPLVPVKESDGRIIYVPRSQAAGREVGSRQTDMNIYKQVQQLGRDFEKANLNTMIPVVERAMQITKEQAGFITGPKGALPDMALPDDVVKSRQALQKLFNITLKDRSGAAVTYQELERLKQEFGAGFFKKPEQLLEAIREARNIVESHYAGVAATHGKDALDRFNENLEAIGGVPFRMSGRLVKLTPVQGATAQPGGSQPDAGATPTVTNEAQYNALPSGAVYIAPDGKTKRKR